MRNQKSFPGLLSAGVAALLAAALAATPASAAQGFDAEVSAGTNFVFQPSDSWSGATQIRSLNSASAFSSPAGAFPFATSHNAIAAAWDSADSGRVTMDGGVSIFQGARLDDNLVATYSSVFRYRFTADADGVLNVDLNAGFTGDPFDVGSWGIAAADVFHPDQQFLARADGYPIESDTIHLTGALRLTAGHFYELDFVNGGSTRNFERTGFVQGDEHGVMTWSITSDAAAVPEPGAWALMLAGFGSAGAMLRGRRRALRAATAGATPRGWTRC